LRIKNQTLYLNPHCPSQWEGYGFQILLNKEPVKIEVNKSGYRITNLGSQDITVQLHQGHEGISAVATDNTAALHLKAGESKFTSR
jgi:trehalose/maltose hydrolase-like predicted phosphorylase